MGLSAESSSAQVPAGAIQNTQITPTTTLTADTPPDPGGVWSIDQVADGFVFDEEPLLPGFVATADLGVISLTFDDRYNVDCLYLWNDVRIQGQGINLFSLNFFDTMGTLIATRGPINAAPGALPDTDFQTFAFSQVLDVSRVDLVVSSSHAGRNIELRELAFCGVVVPVELMSFKVE